jgi:hypothetical protein
MAENDKLWAEENGTTTAQQTVGEDLRSVGVTPGGLGTDLETGAEPEGGDTDIDAPEGGDTSDDVEL